MSIVQHSQVGLCVVPAEKPHRTFTDSDDHGRCRVMEGVEHCPTFLQRRAVIRPSRRSCIHVVISCLQEDAANLQQTAARVHPVHAQ